MIDDERFAVYARRLAGRSIYLTEFNDLGRAIEYAKSHLSISGSAVVGCVIYDGDKRVHWEPKQ